MPGEFTNSEEVDYILHSIPIHGSLNEIVEQLLNNYSISESSSSFESRLRLVNLLNKRFFNERLVAAVFDFLMARKGSSLLELVSKLRIHDFYTFEIFLAITHQIKLFFTLDKSVKEIEEEMARFLSCLWKLLSIPNKLAESLEQRSLLFVYKYYSKRAGQRLMNMISNNDMKAASETAEFFNTRPQLRPTFNNILWSEFLNDLSSRLLALHVETEDIVAFIEPAISVLSVIDPSSYLLERFLRECATYLKAYRGSSFGKIVVTSIKELAKADRSIDSASLNGRKVSIDSPDIDQRNFDAPMLGETRLSTKSADIFAILANLFDSMSDLINCFKEDFVERICSQERKNFESLSRYSLALRAELDKLKAKFEGEGWRDCEVMINDLEASHHLTADALQVIQVSHLFWPEFEMDSCFLPENILATQKQLLQDYLAAKYPQKTFEWTNTFSQVELELSFDNITIDVQCNADEASVLILAIEHKGLSLDDFLKMTSFDQGRVMKSLSKWIQSRVMKCLNGLFSVVDNFEDGPMLIDAHPSCWHASKTNNTQPKSTVDSELLRNLPLVCGVLTNLGPMPLGSIHSHLKKVSVNYQCQESDLHAFLEVQIVEGRLKHTSEGFYDVIQRM